MSATMNGLAPAGMYAKKYRDAGLSIVPIRADGSKASTVRWTEFQKRLPSDDELGRWFLADSVGLAIVYGAVSGNAELLDLDDERIAADFCEALEAVAPGLLGKLPRSRRPGPPCT